MHGFLWPLLKVNRWFITDDVVSLIDEPIFNSNTHPVKKKPTILPESVLRNSLGYFRIDFFMSGGPKYL